MIKNKGGESQQLRDEMVTNLIDTSGVQSLPIIRAFSRIPRENFVPYFLEKRAGIWEKISKETDGYLQKIYTDTSLVVQVDNRGWQCSSSSMPSIMAVMLDALDIHIGNKILEIGTGTGYNAAIMTLLNRDPTKITTIDCENARELSQEAQKNLHQIAGNVNVVIGDGFKGVEQNAPYDRILATASAPTIPAPWIEQLTPGGILVMDLQGTLESGFLVVRKENEEKCHGTFLNRPLYFMPIVSENVSSIFVDNKFLFLLDQPHQKRIQIDDSIVNMLINDRDFRWFLQWYIPYCNIVEFSEPKKVYVVAYNQESIIQINKNDDGWRADAFGTSSYMIWDVLLEAIQLFQAAGKPTLDKYSVDIDGETKNMSTDYFNIKI